MRGVADEGCERGWGSAVCLWAKYYRGGGGGRTSSNGEPGISPIIQTSIICIHERSVIEVLDHGVQGVRHRGTFTDAGPDAVDHERNRKY